MKKKKKNTSRKLDGNGRKNAMSYTEQILEATPYKTTAVRPLTSHLKKHQSKTNKQKQTHKWRSSMDP